MLVAVVEDDPIFGETLGGALEARGFRVELIGTGSAALRRFERLDLDAAIVDMGLPDMDGVEVIARARAFGMWAPILVATGCAALDDLVRALDVGADDYVIKPCSATEIAARLGALSRRASAPRWAQLACGKIVLGADERHAMVDGRPVNLSPRQRALLELLLRRRGQIVPREEILPAAFGYKFDPGTNIVDVHVAHLRQKLEGGCVTIEPVRGVGYRLTAHSHETCNPEVGRLAECQASKSAASCEVTSAASLTSATDAATLSET